MGLLFGFAMGMTFGLFLLLWVNAFKLRKRKLIKTIKGRRGGFGFQGRRGLNGAAGLNGLDGFDGLQGFQGVQGSMGLDGFDGLQGLQGSTIGGGDILINLTAFVDARYGNDATAVFNDIGKPYLTMEAALLVAKANGTVQNPALVFVQPGTYFVPPGGLVLTSSVNFYLQESVQLLNSPDSPMFIVTDDNVTSGIGGYGTFLAVTPSPNNTGGVLHIYGDNCRISLEGVAAVCSAGLAFLSGPAALATTGDMNVQLVDMELLGATLGPFAGQNKGFLFQGNARSQINIVNTGVNDSIFIQLDALVNPPTTQIGSFNSFQTQNIQIINTIGAVTPVEAAIVNHSNTGTIISVSCSVLDAQLAASSPVVSINGPLATVGGVILITTSDCLVGGGTDPGRTTFNGGALLKGRSLAVTPVGFESQFLFRCQNCYALGIEQSFIDVVNVTVRYQTTFTFHLQGPFAPVYLGGNGSQINIDTQSIESLGAFGAVQPFVRLTGSATFDSSAQHVTLPSTFIEALDPDSTINITGFSLTVQLHSTTNISEPAMITRCNSVTVNILFISVARVSSTGEVFSYAIFDFSALPGGVNNIVFKTSAFDTQFTDGIGTVPGQYVDVLRCGSPADITAGVNIDIDIGRMTWNGTQTKGIALYQGSSMEGNLGSLLASTVETLMLYVAGPVNVINNTIQLGTDSEAISATSRAILVVRDTLRLSSNLVQVRGQAVGIEVNSEGNCFFTVQDVNSTIGACVLLNATSILGARLQFHMICNSMASTGSPTPTPGEYTIGVRGVINSQIDASFYISNLTSTAYRAIDSNLSGLTGVDVEMSISVDLFDFGSTSVYGNGAAVYINSPGLFTFNSLTVNAAGILIEPDAAGLGGVFVIENGRSFFNVTNLSLAADAAHLGTTNWSPLFRLTANAQNFMADLRGSSSPGMVLKSATTLGLDVTLRCIHAIVFDTAIVVGSIDSMIYVTGSSHLTYSGLFKNTFGTGILRVEPTFTGVLRQRASTLITNTNPGSQSISCTDFITPITVISEPSIANTIQNAAVVFDPPLGAHPWIFTVSATIV